MFRSDCRLAGTLQATGAVFLIAAGLRLSWNTARTGYRQSDCCLTGSLLLLQSRITAAITVDLLQLPSDWKTAGTCCGRIAAWLLVRKFFLNI